MTYARRLHNLPQGADSPDIDAFGRLRVSDPVTIFDSEFKYNFNSLLWESTGTGGGSVAHSAANAATKLTVDTTSGATAAITTRAYHPYQPGKAQLIVMTCVAGAATANVRKRWGYFDANNGIYVEQNGTTDLAIVRRSNTTGQVVNTRVLQADWNIDKMDGTGLSSQTLDLSKAQILVIDLQWLGVGRVRVGWEIDGELFYCHEFLNANTLSTVYMRTGSLPLRYEMVNTAASAGADFLAICTQVASEGGFTVSQGLPFSASNGATAVSVTTRRAILSIRPAASLNSVVTRGLIVPKNFSLAVSGANVYWELVYNPTLTGTPTWTAANSTHSFTSYSVHGDASAGAITTGGITVASGHILVPSGGVGRIGAEREDITSRLPLTLDIAGTASIPLCLVVTGIGGTATCYGAMDWWEIR